MNKKLLLTIPIMLFLFTGCTTTEPEPSPTFTTSTKDIEACDFFDSSVQKISNENLVNEETGKLNIRDTEKVFTQMYELSETAQTKAENEQLINSFADFSEKVNTVITYSKTLPDTINPEDDPDYVHNVFLMQNTAITLQQQCNDLFTNGVE